MKNTNRHCEARKSCGNLNRFLSLILALILLFSVLPMTALSAYAQDAELEDTAADSDELADTGAEPTFETQDVASHSELRSALRAEGNIRINITGDIEKDLRGSYQVGSLQNDFLFTDRATGLEMAYIVEGKKVLELNGHKLNYTTDTPGYASHVFGYNCIFYISSGAELTVNDNTNSGSITFAFRSNLDDYYNNETLYNNFWGLGTRIVMYIAEGGKLTVNGGEIEGGNSQKIWVNDYFHYNGYAYRQCSGVAIRSYGETVINGGTFIGRGSYDGTLDVYGKINVNDGEFWGRGGADVLSIKGDEDSSVKGGSYNVTIPDYPEAHQYANGNYFTEDFVIGKIGIPASAIDANHTQVHVDGQPNLTKEQIAAGVMTDTSKTTTVEPIPEQTGVMKKYIPSSDSYGTQTAGATYTWDKVTSLRFQLVHDRYYPFDELRSYDQIRTTGYDYTAACFRTTADGSNLASVLAVKGNNWVDLNTMSATDKAKLEVGKTYYLRLTDKEIWDNYYGRHEVNYSDDKLVKVKIVEPDYTMPTTSVGFSWGNDTDDYNKNKITLTPDVSKLDALVRDGTISRYTGVFSYKDNSAASVTYSTVKPYTTASFYRGISSATYTATLYKGDKKLGTVSKTQNVVCFPDITANKPIKEYNTVSIPADASDKTVALSCYTNSTAGLFWTKGYDKISGTGTQKNVDLSDINNCGFYSVGYTMDGEDYYSDQGLYLETSIGSVSATGVTEPKHGAKPTYTATLPSGKGYEAWDYNYGPNKNGIRWYNVTDDKDMYQNDTFEGGKQYRFTIVLVPTADGYRFDENVTGTVNGLTGDITFRSGGFILLSRTFTCPEVLSAITVSGTPKATIGKSAAGSAPGGYVTVADGKGEITDSRWQYRITAVKYADFTGTFASGTTYYPSYTIAPADDYSFADTVTVTFDGGTTATATRKDDGTITVRGPGVQSSAVTKINPIAVTVTAPVHGEKPVYSATVPSGSGYKVVEDYTGTGFSNGVYWYNVSDNKLMTADDTFKYNRNYMVKIDLAVLSGYEFDINNLLKGTVNGNNATVISPSGGISATNNYLQYTFTCSTATIDSVTCNVTKPYTGQKPDFTAVSGNSNAYSVNIESWYLSDGRSSRTLTADDTFVAGKNYYVYVTFSAKRGYTFADDAERTINGTTANFDSRKSQYYAIFLTTASYILGDADGNGDIESVDATFVQRYAANIPTPYTDTQLMCGDVDSDGDLTVMDSTAIQYYLAHLKTDYAIGETVS